MSDKFDQLVAIMAKLRSPKGCPWDREQNHQTLIPFLIEEAYEVVEAIEKSDSEHLADELGDLLLQIVFHAQMASEENRFDIDQVIQNICDKLIRRHPHVFANGDAKTADQVLTNWEIIKQKEKLHQKNTSLLDSIPKTLPALKQAFKLSKKASKVGFDWEEKQDVIKKIQEEVDELTEAFLQKDPIALEHELGDLFFSLTNLSRFLKIDPEEALRKTNGRFRSRFAKMEEYIKSNNLQMTDLTLDQWDQLWKKAKKELS